MPAHYEMSWEPTRARWWKMYRGRRYVVSCRQLGTAPTKEASYKAANAYWIGKRAEVDGTPPERTGMVPYPEHVIQVLSHRRDWAAKHDPKLAKRLSADIEEVKRLGEDMPFPEMLERFLPEDGIGDSWVWRDRISRDKAEPVPVDRTVKALISRYLASQQKRAKAGEITEAEVKGRSYSLAHFLSFLGAESPIDVLTPERWQEWYEDLLSSGRSRSYASKLLNHSRWFVRHLNELEIHPAPKNLDKKSIKLSGAEVRVFKVEEVRSLWARATPTLQLLIGLAINCGMTQKDISDLMHDEVNWDRGIVTRKRSKSKDQANAPTVSYRLWPEVFTLLTQLRSQDPTRVLVTKTGKPWIDRQGKNVDNIRIAFGRLSPILPFKHLRKTSSSLLGSHAEHGRYAQYFLGHAPGNVADARYVRPSQDRFDEAVNWLRESYFHGFQ